MNKSGTSQDRCEKCSADHARPSWKVPFVSCISAILMQSFQMELDLWDLVLISHLYREEIVLPTLQGCCGHKYISMLLQARRGQKQSERLFSAQSRQSPGPGLLLQIMSFVSEGGQRSLHRRAVSVGITAALCRGPRSPNAVRSDGPVPAILRGTRRAAGIACQRRETPRSRTAGKLPLRTSSLCRLWEVSEPQPWSRRHLKTPAEFSNEKY